MSAVKLGVNLLKALPLGDTEHLDAIKNAGFDAFFTDSCNRERSLFWAEEAAKRGLVLQSFHAPFGSVHKIWQDGDEGEQILRELEGCVINASESGVGIVVLHPFIGFKDHSPTKIGEERFLRLARLARDKGIRLAFENVEGEEYLEAVMTMGLTDTVGFCWDSGHEMCYNRGRDRLALYGDRLFATHINDNRGISSPDGEISPVDDLHLVPFDGAIDWEEAVSRLKKCGFNGPLMLELKPGNRMGDPAHQYYSTLSPQEFYELGAQRGKRLVRMLEEQ